MLGRELGRPVAVSPQPKHAVALGAALLAGGVVPPAPSPPKAVDGPGATPAPPKAVDGPKLTPPPSAGPPPPRATGTRRPALVLAGLVVAALLLAFAVPLALRPSPGTPVGLLADNVDVGSAPVLDRALDRPVVLNNATGATAAVTARLGPIPLADGTLAAGAAGVLDLRPVDRFLGGPIPVTATVADAPEVHFVVDPPRLPAASFWLPVGIALFVIAYVESLLRPVRRRRRVRRTDAAAFTALGAISGAGLTMASWAMAGNVVPTWLAVAIVVVGAGVGAAGAALLRATVRRKPGP